MNTTSTITITAPSTDASLFVDRPLDRTDDLSAPYSLTAPVGGEGWEFALRFVLVLCLLASMMTFGFGMNATHRPTGENTGTAPRPAAKTLERATPLAFPVAARQDATARRTTL